MRGTPAPPRGSPALPRLWLVTDGTRLPDPLPAAARLPRGSGVVFRHYGAADRESIGRALARLCRQRRLMLLVAEDAKLAYRLCADGIHLPEHAQPRIAGLRRMGWRVSVAAHSAAAVAGARGADMLVLSPVFPTLSHPGARTLGPVRFAALARAARAPVIALGGITGQTARRLHGGRVHGFAAIGALA